MGIGIRTILVLFMAISPLNVFPQNGFSENVIEPLTKDALYREKVFIHLNKSIYFTNENIWFKAYVVEEKNMLSGYTTNLRVNLLDIEGNVVDSKELFVKKGMAYGDFFIENDLRSGSYFVQGYTHFMRNFGPQNVFLQEIEIINPSNKGQFDASKTSQDYVVQIFPESGHFLEDVNNTMAIKVTSQLKGHTFQGKIVDSKGANIATFSGNRFGMGKCAFYYKKNESYTAIISINNKVQSYVLPKADKKGFVFNLDNSDEEIIKLRLMTNKETLQSLKNEELNVLLYRNNTIYEAVSLSLGNVEETTQELLFNKTQMLPGVNSIALFKNNQPIAERKFFVDKPNQQTAVLIEQEKIENDSILFKIKTIGPDYKSMAAQLSVSILPLKTRAFSEHQNLKSGFLLSPYVKGYIENPSFYFNNADNNEKAFLDVLLLTQVSENRTLKKMIEEINPREKFSFKNGFTLSGTIKKHPKGYDLGILSSKNRLAAISGIDKNKEFYFEDVFTYRNEAIKLSLIKKNSPLKKPERVSFHEPKSVNMNYSYLTQIYDKNQFVEKNSQSKTETNENVINTDYPRIEILDEVLVEGVRPNRNDRTIYDEELVLADKHNILSSWSYKSKKVTEQLETINETLFDYFRNLGHIKPFPSNKVASYFITLRSAPATIIDLGGKANPDGSFPPKIFIDDVLINRDYNIDTLSELSMRYVDEILINKSGAGGGVDGTGGIIRIYLKKGDHQYFDGGPKDLYETVLTSKGFDRAKKYIKPQYTTVSKEAFYWTEIDWINLLETDLNGEAFFKVPKNEFSNEFRIIVNGISNSGLLFHGIFSTGTNGF